MAEQAECARLRHYNRFAKAEFANQTENIERQDSIAKSEQPPNLRRTRFCRHEKVCNRMVFEETNYPYLEYVYLQEPALIAIIGIIDSSFDNWCDAEWPFDFPVSFLILN
jgi:hypothetical protein